MTTHTDLTLDNFVNSLNYSPAAYKLRLKFVPMTVESLSEVQDDAPPPRIKELGEQLRSKFNYMVDLHFVTGGKIFVRPKRSNLYTACVWWNDEQGRFEVLSPRIDRERRLRSSSCLIEEESHVVAIKDTKRAAGFIAGLASYTDTEMARFVVNELLGVVNKEVEATKDELSRAFRSFRYRLDTETYATEILSILDAIKDRQPIALSDDSPLLTHYSEYDTERKRIQEKESYVGDLAPMFMFRSVINGKIVLIGTDTSTSLNDSFFITFDNFEDLPVDVQRAVRTLEVKEKDEIGKAKGVGVVAEPEFIMLRECCGFVVPTETLQKFVEQAQQL